MADVVFSRADTQIGLILRDGEVLAELEVDNGSCRVRFLDLGDDYLQTELAPLCDALRRGRDDLSARPNLTSAKRRSKAKLVTEWKIIIASDLEADDIHAELLGRNHVLAEIAEAGEGCVVTFFNYPDLLPVYVVDQLVESLGRACKSLLTG